MKEAIVVKKQLLRAAALAIAILFCGCQQAPPAAPKPDLKAEAAKIKETDAEYMRAYQARDGMRYASFFAEDGSWYIAEHPKATGREAIQKLATALWKNETSSSWTTTKLEVSEAADLAYQTGTWEATEKDPNGRSTKTIGKFVTVWEKQSDGSWKVQEDCSNPDGPPTPVK